MKAHESVVHGKELSPEFGRVIFKSIARHHPGRCSAARMLRPQNRVHRDAVRVWRKQFPRLNGAGVDRNSGQPGQGIEPRGQRDTKCFSELRHRPPHRVSNRPRVYVNRELYLVIPSIYCADCRDYSPLP